MRLAAVLTKGLFGKATTRGDDIAARTVKRLVKPRAPVSEIDPVLAWPALILLMLGLVMVYSASVATAEGRLYTGYQASYFLVRHTLFLGVGLVAGLAVFRVPMEVWQRWAPWFFLLGVVLLALTLIPGIGLLKAGGGRRWLPMGPVSLQPSELMKLFAAIYAADYTVRKLDVMSSFKQGFMPMMGVILFVGCLLLFEPDFGAFVVVATIAFGVLFLGGVGIRVFLLLGLAAVAGFILLIQIQPYMRARILGFMDPWADPFKDGYQLTHALIAFGRGELFGVGLGGSIEKLFYLPESHTDFLLAVIAEELGFAGVFVVVALFALLVQRAFVIGREAIRLERYFSGLVAQAIGLWVGVQAFISMGVNMGLLPTKGLTLPLMSYGGSALLANCMALGILLRIDWETREMKRGGIV
ncbi:MAG: putative lipid II flippase FtsW [Betaproteobacteria bacterium]|nr:putative lipid II flippase FtsW [Betaproteobacteria bacterium]